MILFIFVFIGFFVGSFPTAFVVAKKLSGVDIRKEGSGNVGATNTFRVLGKGPGIFVFVVDFLKGFLPVFVYARIAAPTHLHDEKLLLVGSVAILGHVFTPFLGFKGGKGVATGAGVLCAALPIVFVFSLVTWLITFLITRVVSISSLVALGVLSVASLALGKGWSITGILLGFQIFIVWTHRSNISRLRSGQENTFNRK